MLPALLGGCASYRPAPLTAAAVEARLQPPAPEQLQVLARQLQHPLLPPIKLNPDEGLTPDRAAVLAVLLNPALRAVRDRRGLARAQLLSAGLLPDPELSLSADVPSGGDRSGKVTAYGLGVSWDVTALLSRGARVSGAQAGQQAVDLDLAWQEWQVAQAAKAAAFQWAVLKRQVVLAEQISRQAADQLARLQQAVASGFLSRTPLAGARIASRQADARLLDLRKQADQQQLRLKRLLGLPADAPLQLAPDLALPSRVELPDDATLRQGLEERRLDLLALRRGYASQEAAVRAAILEQFPKIVLGPTLSRDSDGLRTVGFTVSIDLPLFNRNRGRIAEARATRQLLFDEYANRVFAARGDIASLRNGLEFVNRQLAATATAAAQSRQQLQRYRTALADGRIDALAYQAAWNEASDLQMRQLELQGTLAKGLVALQLATGCYALPQPRPAAAVGPSREVSP